MPRESSSPGRGRRTRTDRQTGAEDSYEYPSYRHQWGWREPLRAEEQRFGGGYRDFSGDEQKDLYGEARPGPFAGVGPKGYKRSDARIFEDVCERLMEDGHVDASGIEVEVQGAEVTLKGSVPTRYMKRLAEDLSVSVLGVKDVLNQLRIKEA
jgi:hypothetical protein